MEFEELTPEQQAKARACTTPEEILALAKAEGIELSDAQIQDVSGGSWLIHSAHGCPEDFIDDPIDW